MQVLDPADVDVEWDDTLGRRRRKYRWKTKDVPAPRITHLRFHPRSGELEGLSPIEAARLTWEGAAYFRGVGVILVQRFRCSLRSVEGSHSSHRRRSHRVETPVECCPCRAHGTTAVLSGGMEYEPVELITFGYRLVGHTLVERPGGRPDLPNPLRPARK